VTRNPIGFYVPSGGLFDYAKNALQEIEARGLANDQVPNQRESIIAIMFSALTVEAFVNEVGDYAAFSCERNPGFHPPEIEQLGTVLQELKDQRSGGSIETKYVMAKWLLRGTPYDRSAAPFQNFKLLVELRNTLVHIPGVDLYEITSTGPLDLRESPRIIRSLEPERILADETDPGPPPRRRSWIEQLLTRGMARWACISASAMIRSLVAAMPDTEFAAFWRGMYDVCYHVHGGPPSFQP